MKKLLATLSLLLFTASLALAQQYPVVINTATNDGIVTRQGYSIAKHVLTLCWESYDKDFCTPLKAAPPGSAKVCPDAFIHHEVVRILQGNYSKPDLTQVTDATGRLQVKEFRNLPALTTHSVYALLIACNPTGTPTGIYVLVLDLDDMDDFPSGPPQPDGIFRLGFAAGN